MKRVGLALEGLLVDVHKHFEQWKQRQGGASSYMDPKVINDETFWATLKPHNNSEVSIPHDVFVLTERPQKLFPITRSWLKRAGVVVGDDNIIMGSLGTLKRYDCRLHDLDYYIDSDPEVLSGFVYDRCIPIGIGDGFEPWIRTFNSLSEVEFGEDLRTWRVFP